jgi:hypothetical protein
MSKSRSRKRSGQPAASTRASTSTKRRAAATLVVCLALAGAAAALWAPPRGRPPAAPPATAQQPTPTPLALAKEYVYAGGRLVATEEPTAAGPAPAALEAVAVAASSVSLTWEPPATGAVTHYIVERAAGASGPFTRLTPDAAGASFTDSAVSPDTAYLYRVRAVFSDGTTSGYGDPDLATAVAFSTPAPAPGVRIRAAHLNELRRAVQAVRALAGLAPAAWSYPDPVPEPAAQRRKVYLEDVAELRSRLDEALAVLGAVEPYPQEPPLGRGAAVKAAHFEQIKERVR